MDDLYNALIAGDWPHALELAVTAWRTDRAPALADIIDHVTARCDLPVPPDDPAERQAWWIEHATSPDPVTVGALLGVLTDRAHMFDAAIGGVRARWASQRANALEVHLAIATTWPTNFQERVALLLRWDHDPRIARALVDCMRAPDPPHAYQITAMYDLIADRIAEIGDRRLITSLERMSEEPRGQDRVVRATQTAFAKRALEGLLAHPPFFEPGPRLRECLALVAPPAPTPPLPPRIDVEALWREVAANPRDVGTRAVLGDALIECGDLRGDVIVLQCNARVAGRPLRGSKRTTYDGRVKTLLRTYWETWFGDLSLVIVRRGSEFRCGMLEVARIGTSSTPPWAFAKARGHRELCAVHTVRPSWITPEDFATFVMSLSRFPPTLGIAAPEVFDELAKRNAPFDQLHTVELVKNPVTSPRELRQAGWVSRLRFSLERVAELAPQLREIHVRDVGIARELGTIVEVVPKLFPSLVRLAVDKSSAAGGYLFGFPVEVLPD